MRRLWLLLVALLIPIGITTATPSPAAAIGQCHIEQVGHARVRTGCETNWGSITSFQTVIKCSDSWLYWYGQRVYIARQSWWPWDLNYSVADCPPGRYVVSYWYQYWT